MPSYDFECKSCKHKFTERISTDVVNKAKLEDDIVECPECKTNLTFHNVVLGVINFTMNRGFGQYKRYRNENEGPRPIINGQIKSNMHPKW